MRRVIILVTAALAACGVDDGEPDLVESPEPPEEIEQAKERIDPTLQITQPGRALFTDAVSVTLNGTATAGTAPVTGVEVNGIAAPLDGSFFEVNVPLHPGLNVLGVRAEAEDKGRAVDALSILSGRVHPPGTELADAVQIHLGREFLDDDDDDLDDISAIVALIIADETFLQSLTSEPFAVGDDTVTVERIEVADAEVDLVPETNCVDAALAMLGVELDLTTTGIAAILGEEVYMTADAGTVEMLICGTSTPGEFEVIQSNVEFDNLILATDEYPDLATDLPGTHETLVGLMENALNSWLGSSLGGFLTDLLDIFQLDYSFGGLDFSYRLSELSAHPDGLDLMLSGSVSSQFGLPTMPPGAGSLRTDDDRLADGFSAAPIAIAMSDDALNQLFFAYWWSGTIADYQLDPAALEELPEVFQPLDSFDVALGLPPTLVAPERPEYPFDLAVGEVGLQIRTTEGRNFDAGIHFRSGVNVAIDEQGGMGLAMNGRAQEITVQANVTQSPPSQSPGDVAALLRLIVPSVLGSVDVNYGGFPLPDFELSAFSENVAGFQGRAVKFTPLATARAGDGGGYLMLEGALTETSP